MNGLSRQRDGAAQTREQAKQDTSTAFKDRGLSTDSDLYPDFLIDRHLQTLRDQGLLKRGTVRRVGIVGPGLDFVNKKFGADFYPPQTTQPFAVIDSLLRLQLADPALLQVYTFDISPRVNRHIGRARDEAASGKPYRMQLMNTSSSQWNAAYFAGFQRFWQGLGNRIGAPAAALSVPAGLRDAIRNRAVDVRPEIVLLLHPVEMNAVFQTLPVAPEEQFDLIIGTNIFLYYDAFEQSLAKVSLGSMLRPGGFLLSNTQLAGGAGSRLVDSVRTTVLVSDTPAFDYMYGYMVRNKHR